MRFSPINCRTRLYRKGVVAVICGLIAVMATIASGPYALAQYAKKPKVSKGPRAVGVLELAENGKAHLLPVTIMIDGKFYDAGAYKADPVPMALQPETVYEALQAGSSQGLFTVTGAIPAKGSWLAAGTWQSKADIEAAKARAQARRAKLAQKAPEEVAGPPKLRRAPQSDDRGSSTSAEKNSPPAPSQAPPSEPASRQAPSNSKSSSTAGDSSGELSSLPGEMDAPDRPVLRHQAPSDTTHEQTKSGNEDEPLKGPLQLIPAVSDTDGAEPRPYTYQTKPEEEQKFLKKMLAMAADEVQARAAHFSAEAETPAKPAGKTRKATPPVSPEFRDVQLRIFDLTSSNEPVLVLTANASIPNSKLTLQYSIALVAREDIYGDLHKVFAQTTDNQHLDVLPKYEFIDAVDVDGDGRGELLFRRASDSGTAFSVYAVIGDRLWPLFEGKAGR